MSDEVAHVLSLEQVRHVARLSRLAIAEPQLEQYRHQLSSILSHIAALEALDVSEVEPMTRPHQTTNRLADDEPTEAMPIADLLANAPAVEGPYLAVPKVLGGESG